ncbi:hypothetical protein NW756_012766 [Fusarium oxysporum]|nr:hypothetical protein NW763_014656 [Fusarium oxysporum]KAJ4041213.1 hypothetical protein NW753_010621 [Fusarium oxysporum]KAJ4076757.1 hypothetical protein NW756_012766 [Fusarium oxysporum]
MPRTTPKGSNKRPRKRTTKDLLNAASKRKLSTSPQEQSPCARSHRYSQRTKRSPQLEGLADTQRYINYLKIQPNKGLDNKYKNALKETPNLKAGNIYLIFHAQSSRWLAALLLPLNGLHRVGISETFDSLGLSHNTPSCVTYDLDSGKFEWRDGFGDDEPLSHQRKFPIAYYLSDPDSPESFNTQWAGAESFWELRSFGLEFGEQSEPQAVAARPASRNTTPSVTPTTTKLPPDGTPIIRVSPHSMTAGERISVQCILPDKVPETLRSLEQSAQGSATVDKLSKRTGIPSSSSEIRGIYAGVDTQQIPENTKLPGILQVASRWPLTLSDRVLRELATRSLDKVSSGPEDFRIPGPEEIYYCPICSNKKRFQRVAIFFKHLSDIHQ